MNIHVIICKSMIEDTLNIIISYEMFKTPISFQLVRVNSDKNYDQPTPYPFLRTPQDVDHLDYLPCLNKFGVGDKDNN